MKRAVLAGSPHIPSSDQTDTVHLGPPDPSRERYPVSIVWTPIPVITWILPFVGHMGICDSAGVCHDFAGPRYIGEDSLAFGNPVKYWRIEHLIIAPAPLQVLQHPDGSSTIEGEGAMRAVQRYDDAIYRMRDHFRGTQMYNFFTNNCHSYCAHCLAECGAGGGQRWNMVVLAASVFFKGKYVSFGRFMVAHAPFIILLIIIAAAVVGAKRG